MKHHNTLPYVLNKAIKQLNLGLESGERGILQPHLHMYSPAYEPSVYCVCTYVHMESIVKVDMKTIGDLFCFLYRTSALYFRAIQERWENLPCTLTISRTAAWRGISVHANLSYFSLTTSPMRCNGHSSIGEYRK